MKNPKGKSVVKNSNWKIQIAEFKLKKDVKYTA